MRSTSTVLTFIGVVALTTFCLITVWPSMPSRYLPGDFWPSGRGLKIGGWERETMRLGLDLRGGAYLVLEATPPADYQGDLDQALDGARNVVENRVNEFGVSEAEIQRTSGNRISVQVPGLTLAEAEDLIGRTAALRFMTYDEANQLVPATGVVNGQTLAMTGSHIKNNTFPTNTGGTQGWSVSFETTSDGARLMEQITTKALRAGIGTPQNLLVVMLDDQTLSEAQVNDIISGEGVITGQPNFTEANNLSKQLNAGALPVPLTIVQSEEVSATLGEDSVLDSVRAGQVGLVAVMLFMILFYRLPGLVASLALGVYALITLMVFKIWPVTLTLSGIAAFVLSIGIAVDANILIFERMKEELRRGRSLNTAIDIGFRRAWSSIRDSNVSTLITCLILYFFGDRFGAAVVQGFALTLAVGVFVSMFSAITVTRTFLKMILGTPLARSHWLFNAEEIKRTPSASRTPAAATTPEEQPNA